MISHQSTVSNDPLVSIIIRSKNEEQFIAKTLSMLFEQKVNDPFEIILIDSGSSDRTVQIAKSFDIRLIEISQKNFTYGYALNLGASQARGKYLINLSAHCVPFDKHWMMNLIKPLQDSPSVGATYGRQVPIDGINPFEEVLLINEFSSEDKLRVIFSNANGALRKDLWEQYKFDEKASFAEDFIWASLLPSSWKIEYVSNATVYHSHPLKLRYWGKRFYDTGIVERYLWHIYELRYAWGSDRVYRKSNFSERFSLFYDESRFFLLHLIKKRYYFSALLSPFYVFIKNRFYSKGITRGELLYSKF